ncbi:protein POOR HOMOLOGOUS SYNAPSIS 1 [Typha latifolia]|uniref:protein POOR HOMOLOGOUS SYNAPSIS 1 n=1 Tax=Typha latifolia TaxID=4733 RepID=UPI003C2D2A20
MAPCTRSYKSAHPLTINSLHPYQSFALAMVLLVSSLHFPKRDDDYDIGMDRGMDLIPKSPISTTVMREEWEVEFSRFFNFPKWSSSSSSSIPAGLRPLPSGKRRSKGTWLTSSSATVLRLLKFTPASVPILSVSVDKDVYEEHFVSNLHFSWPQVACVTQSPIRGSRVVFFSYRDSSSQIQKFSVRFPSSRNAETFLNCVKECSRDTMDIVPPGSDFVCEDSSLSEYIASNCDHYRLDKESSLKEPVEVCAAEIPQLSYKEQNECSYQPVLANNIKNIFSGFPPSFTELLNNCSSDNEKEQPNLKGETDLAFQQREYMMDSSCHDADKVTSMMEESDLKAQIAKYMTDASFHDMLFKLEKVIDELGGDLAL